MSGEGEIEDEFEFEIGGENDDMPSEEAINRKL